MTPAPLRDGRLEGDRRAVLTLLDSILEYARRRDYTGWDYADGMSSRLRRALPVEHKWVNLAFQETAKRAPVNVRPLLLVEQRRNFMGTGLFAMANLTAARQRDAIGAPAGDVDYREQARGLLEWLLDNRCPGYSGFCGGHTHRIQALSGQGDPSDADAVSTAIAVRALLDGEELDRRYPEVARTAADFVIEDLNYREVDGGAKVDYHMNHPDDSYTINAAAMAAHLLLDLYERFGDEGLRDRATAVLDHVATLQTDLGGWHYREPPSASHLSMDNHHNGLVIECFQRHGSVVGDGRYADTLDRALSFYRDVLFDDHGAPNYDETSPYPRDVHAAAQGILVFSSAGEFAFARRILDWTLANLYAGDGRFYFRKYPGFTKRHVLMRWCQAWMAYAVAEYLAERFPAERREPRYPPESDHSTMLQ